MLTEKELGERLKNVREVRRISQFRLGEMVECGQGHIGKLEKGEHAKMHRYTVAVLQIFWQNHLSDYMHMKL